MSNTAPSSSSSNEIKFTGVRKRKWGKYVSEIRLPNSRDRIWLGSYDTAEKAARAFDAALFCLRGPNAKFNFPEDPPDFDDGQSLSPSEIQAVAQHYANSRRQRREERSPSSNCEPPPADLIDWSFLDMLGENGGGNSNINNNSGSISDYGLFDDPVDMYTTPYFASKDYGDDDEDGHGNMTSFLWSF